MTRKKNLTDVPVGAILWKRIYAGLAVHYQTRESTMKSDKVIRYSYTDDEVMFYVRLALFAGCIIGGLIIGALMRAYS